MMDRFADSIVNVTCGAEWNLKGEEIGFSVRRIKYLEQYLA